MASGLNTLEYARRLRDAGLTPEQAEGHARALAAAMTDSLATKADLRELEVRTAARFDAVGARFETVAARFDALESKIDARFDTVTMQIHEVERRMELRLGERLSDLERRMTVRLLAGVAAVSTLVKLL